MTPEQLRVMSVIFEDPAMTLRRHEQQSREMWDAFFRGRMLDQIADPCIGPDGKPQGDSHDA